MRFKKLELLGFKSFAEPTELIFEPGVTAVVGPNGCGKSNIADAIKWVLGEQSARELRGGKMEDLIFNGSDRRDPIHFAQVSLTLDNSAKKLPIEYSEVTIARRLYRTGESEYLLNGSIVRLKDVTELLMGTGIGTSAYSLFEQGRIEQIINARPEDRRVVFEEAAGITKYKSQKREAMRRLEETEDNLARVSDVVAEVRRQIQALERQVRRAKQYQEQMEELKTLETRSARRELAKLKGLSEEKEGILGECRLRAEGLESQAQGWEQRVAEAREKVSGAEESFGRAREGWLALIHRQENARGNLEMTRERIAEGQAGSVRLRQEIASAEAQVAQLEAQHRDLSETVAYQERERREKEEKISQCCSRLEECARVVKEAQLSIVQARERLLEVTGSQVQVKNTLNRVRQEAARLEARAGRLQLESTKVTAEQAEAENQVRIFEENLQQTRVLLEGLEKESVQAQENLSATERELSAARQEVSSLEQELARVGSQWELLKGLLASHEGYSSGVKSLLTALDSGAVDRAGVVGVLAELIQVERADQAAVDAALGPWAESIVVENVEVADRCRRFLEESKSGRVLFLLLDRVPAQISGRSPEQESAAAIRLIDRIGITPHLSSLLELLLADTWLVPNWDSASALRLEGGRRFVTPEGELWTAESALLGSAPAEEGLIVGRMSRFQSLEISVGHCESRLEQAREKARSLQGQRESQVQTSAQLEGAVRERAEETHRLETGCANAKSSLEKLRQEQQLLRTEGSEVEEELAGIRLEVDRWEKELAGWEQELETQQAAIHQAQDTTAQTGRMREEISVELATARSELASFDEVVESRRASLQVLGQSIENARLQSSTRQEELTRQEQRQKEWEAVCQELEQALSRMEGEQAQAQIQVDQADRFKSEVSGAAQEEEKQFRVIRRQLDELQSQLHGQEMERAQVAFQQEQIVTRLRQVYAIELSQETGEGNQEGEAGSPEPRLSEEEQRSRIEELSHKLQRMGPVNLASIDEERELQNRHEYLTTQQADLLKAKEDLHEAILKINRTTRAMFRETFQAIQKEFQVAYRQLFGGGEARLVLMDEEDVLESGIEIIARPPGKALQPISLLSGGEKALTTIALLFAIFRIKPSPFCLLDEIDAPLDELNVDRFTRALREFLRDSQFIIITHNKKTMSMADIMYGITMQEMGVSKIVSVKFKGASSPEAPVLQPAP